MKVTSIIFWCLVLAPFGNSHPAQSQIKQVPISVNTTNVNPALTNTFYVNFLKTGRCRALVASNPKAIGYNSKTGARIILDPNVCDNNFNVTLKTRFYIMFGKITIDAKLQNIQKVNTAIALQSDAGDEINFQLIDNEGVYTDIRRNGSSTNQTEKVLVPCSHDYHTYTIEWRPSSIKWSIDGECIRTLSYSSCARLYPQTPMLVSLGSWSSLTSMEDQFESLSIKRMRIENYSTGIKYEYSNSSPNLDSVTVFKGEITKDGPVVRRWFKSALHLAKPR